MNQMIRGGKKLYRLIGIGAIIILIAGIILLALGIVGDEQISAQAELLMKIFGSLGAIVGIVLIAVCGVCYFKNHKDFALEENDERNIAIRGRAAQLTCLVQTVMLACATIICLAIELFVATYIISTVMLASSFLQMLLIGYYHKKM